MLLPIDHPQAPMYWMYETSGMLSAAVHKYFSEKPLTAEDISYLRAYIRQWIFSPVWEQNPYGDGTNLKDLRDMVDGLTTREQIDRWIYKALEVGQDPF
jgi:hypothetical protein